LADLSLRNRLLLGIMPLIVLGFLAVSSGAYWYINGIIKEELSKSMLISVGKSAESINRWLQTIMIEPETIATTPAAKNINSDFVAIDTLNINRHIFLREKYPNIFQDIYAANSRGEYHTVQEKNGTYSLFTGDIANRPYFLSIMSGGPTQITPPLISRTTGVPTIFLVSPIVNNGKPVGLIGAGLSLKYIQQIVKNLNAGGSGYGFLISQDGRYIYHPNEHYILHSSISQQEDATAHQLGDRMLSGGSGTFRFIEGNVEMESFYHPIPIAGWSIARVLPVAELFAPATRMIRMLAVIIGVFLVVISIAIFLATARLTAPLRVLAVRAQEIAEGKLNVDKIQVHGLDEIGRVADAFNVMTENLADTMSTLKESEDRYRGIFENSVEGIFQTSLEGKILNANPACMKMLGFEGDKSNFAEYDNIQQQLYVDPQDRVNFLDILKNHNEIRDYEVRFYKPSREIIWVSINASLIKSKGNTPGHIEGTISDITEKKKAEEERKKLQEQLLQVQKMEAVGQLAGGVAHDFNNMLAVILGLTELAILKMSPDDRFYNTFQEIRKAAEHSSDLTRQLLAFARKQTVEPQVIDLEEAIVGIMSMLRRLIGEDMELKVSSTENLWPVRIDPGQLRQILTNLCINARDAISGGGCIAIETQNIALSPEDCAAIPDSRPGEYVMLSVADNGKGMDEATKVRVFEPFFTTRGEGKGTGLGLATVYGIVMQNEAFINIESKPGRGTVICIYLPRHTEARQQKPAQQDAEKISTGNGTILLIEDEPELLNITRKMLEQLGYTVYATTKPGEALALAAEKGRHINILMTDVVMPIMNGRELSEKVKAILPDIKCLFMSGYTRDIIANKGILDEGLNFIEKPFSMKDLARKMRGLKA